MFDTKLRKIEYDRLNSVIERRNMFFYPIAGVTHLALLSFASYALRYRTLNKLQVLVAGSLYYQFAFKPIN